MDYLMAYLIDSFCHSWPSIHSKVTPQISRNKAPQHQGGESDLTVFWIAVLIALIQTKEYEKLQQQFEFLAV